MNSPDCYKYTASICCMYKNESLHILEWIEYHRSIGFDHFYLYNNRSNDDIPVKYKNGQISNKTFREAVIQHYTDLGILTHNNYDVNLADDNFPGLQTTGDYPFNHCINNYRTESKWVAFIDMDEFIVINHDVQNISYILNEKFKHTDGICLNSRVFGASGHYFEPKGLVVDNYRLYREKLDPYTKAFYKSSNNNGLLGPHCVLGSEGTITTDGSGKIIKHEPILHGTVDPILFLHHYISKSLWYWLKVKLSRVYDIKSLLDMERPNDWIEEDSLFQAEQVEYRCPVAPTLRGNYVKNRINTWDRYNDFCDNSVYSHFMDLYIEPISIAIDSLPFENVYPIDFDKYAVNPIDEYDKLNCWIDPIKYITPEIKDFAKKSDSPYTISSIMRYYYLFDAKRDEKPIKDWIINVETSTFSKTYHDAIISNDTKIHFRDFLCPRSPLAEYFANNALIVNDNVIRFFCQLIYGNLPHDFSWEEFLEQYPYLRGHGLYTEKLIIQYWFSNGYKI